MTLVPSIPPYGLRFRDIPVKNTAVAAYAGEGGVVLGDGNIQDFVAVCGIGLDELGCAGRLERVAAWRCGWARGVVEADGTVGGAT